MVIIDFHILDTSKREEHRKRKVKWYIAMRPGKRRVLSDSAVDCAREKAEVLKASIRAKVEHPIRVIKRQFGFSKVRYRGLLKNDNHLHTMFALSNLYMARRALSG